MIDCPIVEAEKSHQIIVVENCRLNIFLQLRFHTMCEKESELKGGL